MRSFGAQWRDASGNDGTKNGSRSPQINKLGIDTRPPASPRAPLPGVTRIRARYQLIVDVSAPGCARAALKATMSFSEKVPGRVGGARKALSSTRKSRARNAA